jgi:hypothetical protein
MAENYLRLECINDPRHAQTVEDRPVRLGDGRVISLAEWWINIAGRRCEQCRKEPPPVTQPKAKAMARRDGPRSSQVAAALAAPKAGTRKAKVLAVLQSAAGQWVPGEQLANPQVGGSEGLKRLRELRADGWLIEEKPPPGGDGMWWYRMGDAGVENVPEALF